MTSSRFRNVIGVLTALLVVCAAALTAGVVGDGGPGGIDRDITAWAIAQRNDVLTPIAVVVSLLGGTLAMTALATATCLVLSWRRRWSAAALVALTGLGGGLLVRGGKRLTDRDRPPVEDHLISVSNQAYPSGHGMGSFVVVGIVLVVALPSLHGPLLRASAATAAAVFVAAIGLSRIYLGVHWTTDILGAWCFGALWLILCLTVYRYSVRGDEVVGDPDQRNSAEGGRQGTASFAPGNVDTPSSYGRG
ncbi:phosphatase PAP2 family protein [Nocardia abscessus]|uniref:Phosphatase PAP2 family protein n=1 Tax=Nocardia abscessus TaxID=120957 RepID=A0ABS0C871_9NOCA|nr:phosphatase PAP2 family protein [Nocardia abscessus]MBF6224849.1 phosphatase PAP2 family protein [Nocardia abscessus]